MGKTVLYYFSGTGNSLHTARKLGEFLDGAVYSMAGALKHGVIQESAERVGLVFPCYLAQLNGVPSIVEDFLPLLPGTKPRYIFGVCTYGCYAPVNAYPTLRNLALMLKGKGLVLGGAFSIKLPLNNLDYDHVPVPINRNHEIMFAYTDRKLGAIAKRVWKEKQGRFVSLKDFWCWLSLPLFRLMGDYAYAALLPRAGLDPGSKLPWRDLVRLTDTSISVDGNCTGCGTCSRICPVGNITMVAGRPQWNHSCELCIACDEYCPERAIRHWIKSPGKNYRHPDVTVQDMLGQAGKV